MTVVEQTVGELADLLRACFETALGRDVCLRPGAIVDLLASTTRDECCEGTAWVRVGPVFAGFPAPDQGGASCFPPLWSVILELGAARCAPTPAADEIPTCEQNTALTLGLLDDMAAMMCAVSCFSTADDLRRIAVGTWDQTVVEGRCAGSTLTVTVAFTPCLACPD